VIGSCEHDNEPVGSIKGEKFLTTSATISLKELVS
jgi:hypothetical protein